MKTRLRSIIERVVTYSLIAVAIGALVYFLSYVNTQQKQDITAKEAELAELEEKIASAKLEFGKRRKQVSSIAQQLRERKKEIKEKFEKLLEKASNYTVFIEQVQRKAKALDIHIHNSEYQPPKPAAGAGSAYLEFNFALRARGPYNKVKQFLWEMENSLGRLVKISQIEIIPPMSDSAGNMSLKLTLTTFFKS